jgi:tripartite-type tricarboxylate transporter receptor subunit TctC
MKRWLMVAFAAMLPALAAAQGYPNHAIRIIVPFPPGGPTDLIGRAIGEKLGEAWSQSVIVENKPGAAGNLGVDIGAKAAPDGYTLVIVPVGNIAVNPALYPSLPFKQSDLAPITMLATVENVLVVNPAVPVSSMKELVALAKAKPGTLSFASPGAGSQAHLAGEFINLSAGIDILHVPYKGIAPALNDLLGGQVSMMVAQVSSALPHIRAGKLRAIGIASLRRSQVLPDVPTIAEQGFPGFEAVSWYALMAPAATPKDIVAKLSTEVTRILQLNEIRERFAGLGAEAVGGTPEQLAVTIKTESARWGEVVKKQHITVE